MFKILKRFSWALTSFFFLSFVLFCLTKAMPGDPALLVLGEKATQQSIAKLRFEMGLDEPFHVQYLTYLKRLIFEGDWGESLTTHNPVIEEIGEKFPATVELSVSAVLIAVLVGLSLGLAAAKSPGSLQDICAMVVGSVGISLPVFWLGLLLTLFFAYYLDWFPISGRLGIEFNYEPVTGFLLFDSLFFARDFDMFVDALRHLVLPAVTLSSIPLAFITRMTRSAMVEVSKEDFIRTAKAKGLKPAKVYYKHVFRNAAIPVVTLIGLQLGTLMGGAVITETIFSWPGIGSWLLHSISSRDLPAIEGGVMVVCAVVALVNFLTDFTYQVLDPRVTR